MKIDRKSMVIGLLLASLVFFAFGYTQTGSAKTSDAIRWGMIVPADGKVLVRDRDGLAFLVETNTGSVTKLEYAKKKVSVNSEQLNLGVGN